MHPVPAAVLSLIVAVAVGTLLGLTMVASLAIGAGAVAAGAVIRSLYREAERRFREFRRNR